MSQLSIGIKAPDFELYGVDGQSYRLGHALDESPVVLAFYKSACPVSQFTLPYLQRIYAHAERDERSECKPDAKRERDSAKHQVRAQPSRKATGFKMWGVSQDDESETRAFAKRYGIEFNLVIDEYPYPVSTAYGLEFVPGIFIVHPGGLITLSHSGFHKSELEEIATLAGRPPLQLFERGDGIPDHRPG